MNSNDVLFYTSLYGIMAVFVSLVLVGTTITGPKLTPREVVEILVTGVLWPLFMVAGAGHMLWEGLKWTWYKMVDISNRYPPT